MSNFSAAGSRNFSAQGETPRPGVSILTRNVSPAGNQDIGGMSYVIRMSSGPTGLGCIALQTDLILLPGTCDVQEIQAVCIVCVPKAGTPAVSFFSTRGV